MTPSQEELFHNNLHIADMIAHGVIRRLPSYIDGDDLIQAARIGLLHAAQRWNDKMGVVFSTYAKFRIKGNVIDCLRLNDMRSRGTMTTLSFVPIEEDVLPQRDNPTYLTDLANAESIRILLEKITELPERQQKIIRLYFFEGKDWQNIAKEFKLNVSRIHQIRLQFLKDLRSKLEDVGVTAAGV